MTIVVNIVGIVGSICIALSLFPQTIKTIQKRSMDEISLPFVCVTMVGASCQLLYGIYYAIIPMIIANVCVLSNTILLYNTIILCFIVVLHNTIIQYNAINNTGLCCKLQIQ